MDLTGVFSEGSPWFMIHDSDSNPKGSSKAAALRLDLRDEYSGEMDGLSGPSSPSLRSTRTSSPVVFTPIARPSELPDALLPPTHQSKKYPLKVDGDHG